MNTNDDLRQVYIDTEDHLIPRLGLNPHERAVYYHLLRRSRLVGSRTCTVSIDGLAAATGLSAQVRGHLRKLDEKGCVRIVEKGKAGTTVEVLLPSEIPGCVATTSPVTPMDLETFDFYSDARGRAAIFEREAGACFYCLRSIDAKNGVLDHVVPQAVRLDHSYRNLVAACDECNSLKQESTAQDFLRSLYRKNRLNAEELDARLVAVEAVARGDMVPQLASSPT